MTDTKHIYIRRSNVIIQIMKTVIKGRFSNVNFISKYFYKIKNLMYNIRNLYVSPTIVKSLMKN